MMMRDDDDRALLDDDRALLGTKKAERTGFLHSKKHEQSAPLDVSLMHVYDSNVGDEASRLYQVKAFLYWNCLCISFSSLRTKIWMRSQESEVFEI